MKNRSLLALLIIPVLLLAACATTGGDPAATLAAKQQPVSQAVSVPGYTVVAVGDIACAPGKAVTATTCRQAFTGQLALGLKPAVVIPLGDEQYESGSLTAFNGSYAKTAWGTLKAKSAPVPGNHEYVTAGAAGYYSYFAGRQPGAPGYYRRVVNGWQIYLLNSNCDKVNCATEAAWLDRTMKANPSKCSLIAMHHPRFSSGGEHGNSTMPLGLWRVAYANGNDLVLAGHDHDYERFLPMNPDGVVQSSRGMQSFVVGTGGKSLYGLGTRKAGSAYFQNKTPGVLLLWLGTGKYSWDFRSVAGASLDSGIRSCL